MPLLTTRAQSGITGKINPELTPDTAHRRLDSGIQRQTRADFAIKDPFNKNVG
jgi:hypothetical protein